MYNDKLLCLYLHREATTDVALASAKCSIFCCRLAFSSRIFAYSHSSCCMFIVEK